MSLAPSDVIVLFADNCCILPVVAIVNVFLSLAVYYLFFTSLDISGFFCHAALHQTNNTCTPLLCKIPLQSVWHLDTQNC